MKGGLMNDAQIKADELLQRYPELPAAYRGALRTVRDGEAETGTEWDIVLQAADLADTYDG